MNRGRGLAVVALTGLVVAAGTMQADEEDIAISKLPKSVIEGIKAKYPDATLLSAEKETQGNKTFYEVNIKHKERKIELLLTPEGKIVTVEQAIAAKDLPKAVAQAIYKQYPKGTIKAIEEATRDKTATYAVLLEADVMIGGEKQKVHLQLTSAGQIMATQKLIASKDLPQTVTTALGKEYPNIPITRANEASKGNNVSYIVTLETAEKRFMAVLDAEGKILKDFSRNKKK